MRAALLLFAWEPPQAAQSLAAWAKALAVDPPADVLVLGGKAPFLLPGGLGALSHLSGPEPSRCLDPGLSYAAAADWAAGRYELLLLNAGAEADLLAPSLAWALGGCCLTGLTGLARLSSGALQAVRGACCMELEARLTVERFPAVLTLATRPPDRSPPPAWRTADELVRAPAAPDGWLRALSYLPPPEEAPLSSAVTVLVAGRGAGTPPLLKKLSELARRLDGCVGATRPVVYEGLSPLPSLVGASAAVLSPALCLIFGASGSAAFTVGVERAGVLAGVNLDPDAPLFQHCDYGVIEDCGALLDALLTLTDQEGSRL